jgi:hypothetical protein
MHLRSLSHWLPLLQSAALTFSGETAVQLVTLITVDVAADANAASYRHQH